jgi:hypothetical protein
MSDKAIPLPDYSDPADAFRLRARRVRGRRNRPVCHPALSRQIQQPAPPPAWLRLKPVVFSSEGAILYNQYCFVCHGIDGRGDGPPPASWTPSRAIFASGNNRIISSSNGVPFREDLIRTIRNGMPGTSMPSWRYLSDHEIDTSPTTSTDSPSPPSANNSPPRSSSRRSRIDPQEQTTPHSKIVVAS